MGKMATEAERALSVLLDKDKWGEAIQKDLITEEEANEHRALTDIPKNRLFTGHAAAGSVSAKRAASASIGAPAPKSLRGENEDEIARIADVCSGAR